VREIQILYTVLVSADGKKVVIPNGNLSNQEITNFSTEPLRRIEYTVFMPYSVSATQATRIMREAALADPLVMREPEPWSGVGDLTWQGMRVDLWAWVQRTDYITVHPRLGEAIAERFRQANIPLGGQNYDIQLKRD
jgi:small conductance mechanosensitive channel